MCRSVSLEFLQKADFQEHTPPASAGVAVANDDDDDDDDLDVDDGDDAEDMSPSASASEANLTPLPTAHCTSCPQKVTSTTTANMVSGHGHGGQRSGTSRSFFSRKFGGGGGGASKGGKRSMALRLKLLPSSMWQHTRPPSRSELAAKSLPQVSALN